jgi:hypothetical protein
MVDSLAAGGDGVDHLVVIATHRLISSSTTSS